MQFARLAIVVLVSLVAAGATTRPTTAPVSPELKDVDGVARKPLDGGNAKATVVFFLAHDCPISNGYAPEINRICKSFGGEGRFNIVIAHPYAELTAAEAKKHATDFGFAVPVFVDTELKLTRLLKPKVTPEAIVVAPDGKVLYRGRIDDTWADYGKRRPAPTVQDLRDALSAVLEGRSVPKAETEAIGCPVAE